MKNTSRRGWIQQWRMLAIPLAAIIAFAGWGLSSPVGSSPDDDFHLSSIWCGSGDRQGLCERTSDTASVLPEDFGAISKCFAFDPAQAATCQGQDFGTPPLVLQETERGNFAGLYPPVYYYVMSAFATSELVSSVLVIRIVNSLLLILFITAVNLALPHFRRQAFIGALVVTSVPLAMFLIPSTNPSSWAFLSGATLWITLVGYYETKGRQSILLATLAVLSTVIGAGARADAAVYAGVAVCASLILRAQPTRAFGKKIVIPILVGVLSLWFYLSAGQTNALDGLSRSPEPVDKVALLYRTLLDVPDLFAGVLGKWQLGWLDTPLPALVWVASMGVFFGLLFFGFGAGGIRKAIASLFVLSALWLIPTYISVQSETTIGSQVQPRYVLPLIVMLAGVAISRPASKQIILNMSQKLALVIGLGLANSIALHVNIRRYVTGTDHVGMNLDRDVEWWWDSPVSPMFVWLTGSFAFVTLISLLMRLFSASPALPIPTVPMAPNGEAENGEEAQVLMSGTDQTSPAADDFEQLVSQTPQPSSST